MAFNSARKKKTPLIEESGSSTDDEKCDTENYSFSEDEIQAASISKVTPRSSERIQKKRNKKFHVPSKKEVWDKITPGKSPGKYDQLRPRKLVNNFTKENNRYNYDPNETSGDESLDDFIINDDEFVESSTSSDSACDIKAKKSMRIRGRHHRLRVGNPIEESTSSESDEADAGRISVENKECNKEPRHSVRLCSQDKHCETSSHNDVYQCDISEREKNNSAHVKEPVYEPSKKRKNNPCVIDDENVSDTSSTGSNKKIIQQVGARNKRNRSMIESDNESDECEIRVGRRNKHNRSVIIESDSDEGVDVLMKNTELKSGGKITTVSASSTRSSEVVDISDTTTNDSGIVHESECRSVGCKSLGNEETKFSACNSGSKCEEKIYQLCEATTSALESPGSISVSECANDTEDDSDSSLSEPEDKDDGDDDSEMDDDFDIDTENSRIRIGKLHKKREKEKLFDKLRKERERKLSKSNNVDS